MPMPEMKKEKRGCDTPDFMAELNGDSCSDETAADLANLERFISEDTSDGIINADTFKDLISEIHDLPPEFMEEFDFGSTSESKNLGQQATGGDFGHQQQHMNHHHHLHHQNLDGSRTVDSIVSRLKQEEVEAADREIQAAMLDIGKSMSMNAAASSSSVGVGGGGTTSIVTSMHSSQSSSMTATVGQSFPNQQNHPNQMSQFDAVNSSKMVSTSVAPTGLQHQQQQRVPNTESGQQQQQQQTMGINRMSFVAAAGGGGGGNGGGGSGGNPAGSELSPAALTLKQMAEQHQHKAQMGMTPTPGTGLSAPPTMANQGAPMVQPGVGVPHPGVNMRPGGNGGGFPMQQQQQQQQQPNQQQQYNPVGGVQQQQQFMNHPRPPYTGQGGYGPNSPMIKKEIPYFASSPLGGHSPGPGRPMQQQQQQQTVQQGPGSSSGSSSVSTSSSSLPNPAQLVPGAKSSPVPLSQNSPMGPPTPQQIQQQQQQQFNARKAPTPTNNNNNGGGGVTTGRTPPPSGNNQSQQQQQQASGINVQFNQTQQQQMQVNMTAANNGQQIQVISQFFVFFHYLKIFYSPARPYFSWSPVVWWKHYRGMKKIHLASLLLGALARLLCLCV